MNEEAKVQVNEVLVSSILDSKISSSKRNYDYSTEDWK